MGEELGHTSIAKSLAVVDPEGLFGHELKAFSYSSHLCAAQRPRSRCQNWYCVRGSWSRPTFAGACGPELLLFLVSI